MKIIKSFFLVTVSLCTTTFLHAQEAITTPVKPAESTPAAIVTSVPPPVQPGSTVAPQTATDNIQVVPSYPKKEDNIKTPEKETSALKLIEPKTTNTLNAEPAKVQPLLSPNTNDPNLRLLPVTKSTVVKQQ